MHWLRQMNLCLCPNCASEYKKMRADEYDLECFLEDIENLSDAEIGSMDPVEVAFGNETIWFTQSCAVGARTSSAHFRSFSLEMV